MDMCNQLLQHLTNKEAGINDAFMHLVVHIYLEKCIEQPSQILRFHCPWCLLLLFITNPSTFPIFASVIHLLSYCPNKIYINMEGGTSLPFVHDGCRGWGHSQSVPWSLFHDYLGWCHFGEEIRFPLKVSASRVLFEKLNTRSILFILHLWLTK